MTNTGLALALVWLRGCLALTWKGARNVSSRLHPEGKLTDLVCMRNTGHQCRYFACDLDEFGTDICEDGKCVCGLNSCATAEGRCEIPKTWGRWLSRHAIKFVDPVYPHAPYIGAALDNVTGTYRIQATWDSTPIWNLANSHDNYTRFELADAMGSVLTAQKVCEELASDNSSYEGYINHEKCTYKPAIMQFADAHPLDVDFLVHWTVGGLEIWDPQFGVAFATTALEGSADTGIYLCGPGNMNAHECLGNTFVTFEPQLPPEAISRSDRIIVHQIKSVMDDIRDAFTPPEPGASMMGSNYTHTARDSIKPK